MPKFPFLLLDADVIIAAHEFGVWDKLVERCSITITRTVVEDEVRYWTDDKGMCHVIDLDKHIQEGKISCVDVPLSLVDKFCKKFGPAYLDQMDPGEAESLAFLYYSDEEWRIASGDGIVFRSLGCLALSEHGISLEEIIQKIGLTCDVSQKYQFTKKYRVNLTKKGEQEAIMGMGLKPGARKMKSVSP